MRRTLTLAVLISSLALAGCDTLGNFDPLDKFQDWDIMASAKPPVKGERREVFPTGVPGVPQGVPPDMVKGYQAPPEVPPPVVEAKPPRVKPKKTAAVPAKQPRRPRPAQPQGADDQPMQQAPAARTTTRPVQQGQGQMQTMPGAQPTWPTDAQPAPQR